MGYGTRSPKHGHGDSGDTWPSPGKGRGTLLEGELGQNEGCWGRGSREVCSGKAAPCSDLGALLLGRGPLHRTSAHTHLCKEQRGTCPGSQSNPAPAREDENTMLCPQAPSHAAAAGSWALAELQNQHKTLLEEVNLNQSPNRSDRGRRGRVSGTGEPGHSQSQPTTVTTFPGSQQAGRHQKSPTKLKTGLRQVPPTGREQSCGTRVP